MINLKVLSTAAALALALPMVMPGASFAAPPGKGGPAGGFRGGGGGVHMGGSPGGVHMGGSPGGVRMGTSQFSASTSGVRTGTPQFSARSGPTTQRFSSVSNGGSGNWNGGGRNWHRHGRGFIPGAVAGAVIGGAFANSYGYYDDPGYYDNQAYDDGTVAVVPDQGGDDSVAYCMQTYRSYDPRSGTYMGFDGYRHPCP